MSYNRKISKKLSKNIKIADFFCGVGGIRLGFEQASKKSTKNIETVYSCDFDDKCQITYSLNFEPFTKKDIRNVDEKSLPDFDIFLAGFPCQPFSLAGKKLGFDDERNVFLEIIRILSYKKPNVIFLENVKNLQNHDNGNTFRIILEELEKIGYHIKHKIMNCCKYGNTPQNRERIFIIGFLDENKYEKFKFPEEIKLTRKITDLLTNVNDISKKYFYTEDSKIYEKLENVINNENSVYQYRRHYVRENKSGLCPTLTANMGSGGHNVPIICQNNLIRKLTPQECFRFQGFPDTYKFPKLADCHLYKQAGNSVNVLTVQNIAIEILNVL